MRASSCASTRPPGKSSPGTRERSPGYWKNPEATARTIDADGWLHTGDVGEWVDGTYLKITDRMKDIIITAGGKNVAPSEIENALKASPYIKEAIVIGDARKYLTALIGIELDTVGHWAQTRKLPYTTYRDLGEKKEVLALVQSIVDEVNERFATGRAGQEVLHAAKGIGPRGRRADRHPEGEAQGDRDDVRRPGRGHVPMTELVQCLVRGLGDGSVYALLAFGFVIIYKSMGVISFAQPSLMLAGAVLVTYLVTTVNFYLAVLVAAAAVALLAMGVERTVLRPMIGKPVFVISIITLGVDIVIRVVVNAYIGLDVRPVGAPWGLATSRLLGIEVQQRHLIMFVTTMVLVAILFAFFRYSRMGLAMRAVAFDQEVALAQGVSVGLVFTLSWAIAGALATVAGVFVSTGAGVDQQLWIIALKALPVIILGGLDSLGGAVIAGLAIGVVESLVATYGPDFAPWLGGEFALVTPYLVMMVVLLVRPYGLFGTREVVRI